MGSADEVAQAVIAGADALGFVSAMPSGAGVIDEALIAPMVARVPPAVASFLLTSLTEVEAIIAQQRRCRTSTLQLVDEIERGGHERLRAALPGIKIVQVLHVLGPQTVDEALALAPVVDAFLLDSGNPLAAVKELGGTGRVHDWQVSRAIREQCGRPVFLAGGLRADNVVEAVDLVQPYAVDICSGVRTDGRLDPRKLEAFFAAVAGA